MSKTVLMFPSTFGTSITVPGNQLIVNEFGVSQTAAVLVLTIYTLGLAFGPPLIAPLSEAFGRLWVYRISFTMFLTFTAGAGGAKSSATLLVCRFLAGFIGSASLATGAGTIADLLQLRKSGPAGLVFILGPLLGPMMAPLAGAYILYDRDDDWRWTQWLICMVGAPIWISTWLMKETYIMRRSMPPDASLRQKIEILGPILKVTCTKPVKMLVLEIPVLSLALYSSYTYALVFSYFASCSYILALNYGFTTRQLGLSFLSIVIGYFIAAAIFGICDKKLYRKALELESDENGMAAPEHRLYAAMIGCFFLTGALFWSVVHFAPVADIANVSRYAWRMGKASAGRYLSRHRCTDLDPLYHHLHGGRLSERCCGFR